MNELRAHYTPKLSEFFASFQLQWREGETSGVPPAVRTLLPKVSALPKLQGEVGKRKEHEELRVGILFSGGPAPGGHNVIWGVLEALKSFCRNYSLIGFLNGPKGLMTGSFIELKEELFGPYRNSGGFDLLGTGRDKIETPEQFEAALATVKTLQLNGLIVVGGDDSNTNAAFLSEFFLVKELPCSVIGVPKTIDGDLQNNSIAISFGFDTAAKTYSETIGNIARDALSQKKYHFFIKLMGRSASHLTLECALKTQPNLALIGEEIKERKETFQEVVDRIVNLIREREKIGKNYSVILIPEGVLEFISGFKEQLMRDYPLDPHGNLPVSQIETERLLIQCVKEKLGKDFSAQPLFLGYEGRSAFPTNFDASYTFALGIGALSLVAEGRSGYMIGITGLEKSSLEWGAVAVPLASMMHIEKRKGEERAVIAKALVDLGGEPFKRFAARREKWMLEDCYLTPGPIQFFGEKEITDSPPSLLC